MNNKLRIGGQAVIEGIMMRGKNAFSIVVKKPDGELAIHKENLSNLGDKYPILKFPVLRGCIALFETLILGIKALSFSANLALADENKESEVKKELKNWEIFFTILISLGASFLLFFLLPLTLTNFLKKFFVILNTNLFYNLFDGLLRIGIFISYVAIISQLKEVERVFQYHGAEHKAVFNFESGNELSVEEARKYSPLHPRCGTSFLLLVMVISIIIFSFIPREASFIIKASLRLILIPLISGIAYEIIKLSGNNLSNPFVKILSFPGMLLQKLTTREPTDDQIAIAIVAIKEVLLLENNQIS